MIGIIGPMCLRSFKLEWHEIGIADKRFWEPYEILVRENNFRYQFYQIYVSYPINSIEAGHCPIAPL